MYAHGLQKVTKIQGKKSLTVDSFGRDYVFPWLVTNSIANQEIVHMWDHTKRKSFCPTKETMDTMKKHTEKYKRRSLGKHISDEGLFLKTYKSVILPAGTKQTNKHKNNQTKIGQIIWEDICTKKTGNWPNIYKNVVNITTHDKNVDQNHTQILSHSN